MLSISNFRKAPASFKDGFPNTSKLMTFSYRCTVLRLGMIGMRVPQGEESSTDSAQKMGVSKH